MPDEKPVTDLSPQAVRVGRVIDRLPPGGEYIIRVVKDDLRTIPWQVEISRVEQINRLEPRDV
ncbi:MAG TPA: hypothetical protein VIH16_03725 [Bellilinea sp.]